MKKNKLLRRISVGVAALALICTSAVATSFAKYQTTTTGSVTVDIAKWDFKVDNQKAETFTINPTLNTVKDDTINGDKIAPGRGGNFDFVATNNSDVSATYTVEMKVENKPSNVVFYYDSACTIEYEIGTNFTSYNFTTANNSANDGKLAHGGSTGETITVYWKWVYETEETETSEDTTDGAQAIESATSKMVVTVKVVGTQDDPTPQA